VTAWKALFRSAAKAARPYPWKSPSLSNADEKEPEEFFRFFETDGGLDPYLAYEKSKPHIHNNIFCAWLLWAFGPGCFRG
jgi:hypothetical protein